MQSVDSEVVIARDGTVLFVSGNAPEQWIGQRLEDCSDAPEDVKQAPMLLTMSGHGERRPSVIVHTPVGAVRITAIDAMPLHRSGASLATVLRSSLDAVRQQARSADVRLFVDVAENVPTLIAIDSDKIAWVVATLIDNALREVRHGSMMMPSGSIGISVSYRAASEEVAVEIRDDGPGLSAEKLHGAIGSDRGHAGLALSIVRDVIAAHGGSLELESQAAVFMGGTAVIFTLPVA